MDNLSLQSDEIQALSAIYGDEWHIEDTNNHEYMIELKDDKKSQSNRSQEWERTISLQIRLPPEYPKEAPPFYTLSAPWMSRKNKMRLMSSLEEIYCQHAGESIIYMWIEKAREFIVDEKESNGIGGEEKQDSVEDDEYDGNEKDIGGYGEKACEIISGSDYEFDYYAHHHNHNHIVENVPIYHGEPLVDRRSTFQAHLSPVKCVEEAQKALTTLKMNKKIEGATHNISAYRITGGPHNTCIQDCDDDGENHAGSRLLHLLQILDVKDVLVVVSRWYGGIQLGPDRFKHINNVARDLLSKCGYIDSHHETDVNESSNHPGKGKKKSK